MLKSTNAKIDYTRFYSFLYEETVSVLYAVCLPNILQRGMRPSLQSASLPRLAVTAFAARRLDASCSRGRGAEILKGSGR